MLELIPVSIAVSDLGALLPLDGMLIHRRIPHQSTMVPTVLLDQEKQ